MNSELMHKISKYEQKFNDAQDDEHRSIYRTKLNFYKNQQTGGQQGGQLTAADQLAVRAINANLAGMDASAKKLHVANQNLQRQLTAAQTAAAAALKAAQDSAAAAQAQVVKLTNQLNAANSSNQSPALQAQLVAAQQKQQMTDDQLTKLQRDLAQAKRAEQIARDALAQAQTTNKATVDKLTQERDAAARARVAADVELRKLQQQDITNRSTIAQLQKDLAAAKSGAHDTTALQAQLSSAQADLVQANAAKDKSAAHAQKLAQILVDLQTTTTAQAADMAKLANTGAGAAGAAQGGGSVDDLINELF
jgi:chromosome segregation ATPase